MLLWLTAIVLPLWALQAILRTINLWITGSFTGYTVSGWDYVSAWTEPLISCEYQGLILPVQISLLRPMPPLALALFALQCMWVVMVAVLPDTRKKAKVHWHHIARALVYSLGWLVFVELITIAHRVDALVAVLRAKPGLFAEFPHVVDLLEFDARPNIAFLTLGLWTLWWWYIVIIRHWRLHHGGLVWAVLCIPVLMGALLVLVQRS